MAHFTGFLSHQFEAPELYGCVTQNRTEMRGLELKGVKMGSNGIRGRELPSNLGKTWATPKRILASELSWVPFCVPCNDLKCFVLDTC